MKRSFLQAGVIAEMEMLKIRHEPSEVLTRAVQPILWLLVFGGVFSQVRVIPTDGVDYMEFLTPGVLAQSVLFMSIFYGISMIWERDMGIIQKFLTSPVPRTALVAGRALSAGGRGLLQAGLVLVVALTIGVGIRADPLSLISVLFILVLGAAFFSCMSMCIAALVRTREKFMGIGQMITMPLFFASNAIYPVSMMPDWLKAVALVNPLTYEVDALRAIMVHGTSSSFGIWFDCLVLSLSALGMCLLAAKLYPRVVR